MKTKVIFRKWSKRVSNEVLALFPAEAGSVGQPFTCLSYQHTGQHGAADVGVMRITRAATPEEYANLAAELRRIGYKLDIRHRFKSADLAARKEQLKR